MTAIKQEDLIQSVADAFQYISYYHPLDYIKALGEAYDREESPAAKDAIAVAGEDAKLTDRIDAISQAIGRQSCSARRETQVVKRLDFPPVVRFFDRQFDH